VIAFSERELASLAWIAVTGAAAVFWRPLRDFVIGVASALLTPVFLVPFGMFAV